MAFPLCAVISFQEAQHMIAGNLGRVSHACTVVQCSVKDDLAFLWEHGIFRVRTIVTIGLSHRPIVQLSDNNRVTIVLPDSSTIVL
jgi:hypothetical protein